MSFVRTLLGDISPDQLGFTYSHEHLLCSPPYWVERQEEDLLLDNFAKSSADVEDFKNCGGQSIVDATAIDYGRDVTSVAQISRDLGVHIIGTAGFNKSFLWDAKLIPSHLKLIGHFETYGHWIESSSVNDLAHFVMKEVREGLEDTHFRAGQVKFGTGYNQVSPLEVKTIQAVARAHHETGAPVHSHTEVGTMALEQIELLRREKVNLKYVSFGHMDRNPDPYYHQQVAKSGAYLCFDGIAKVKYYPESTRIECILSLIQKGYEDQILISGDTARKSYYRHYKHGLGLAHIIAKWVPRFIDEAEGRGLDGEALIQKFFVENPARCFSFQG